MRPSNRQYNMQVNAGFDVYLCLTDRGLFQRVRMYRQLSIRATYSCMKMR